MTCAVCQTQGEKLLKCGCCRLAEYCSKECQKKAWPEHKKTCLPVGQRNVPKEDQPTFGTVTIAATAAEGKRTVRLRNGKSAVLRSGHLIPPRIGNQLPRDFVLCLPMHELAPDVLNGQHLFVQTTVGELLQIPLVRGTRLGIAKALEKEVAGNIRKARRKLDSIHRRMLAGQPEAKEVWQQLMTDCVYLTRLKWAQGHEIFALLPKEGDKDFVLHDSPTHRMFMVQIQNARDAPPCNCEHCGLPKK
jgi:hypothetical protein